MRQHRGDAKGPAAEVEKSSNIEERQVSGRNYDPSSDDRDMHRLGKSQELKVRNL